MEITYFTDYERRDVGMVLQYAEISTWDVRDTLKEPSHSCLTIVASTTAISYSFFLRNENYGPTLLHLRHAFEFFWNQKVSFFVFNSTCMRVGPELTCSQLEHDGNPSLPFTTHGRSVARIFTLQGHRDPPQMPLGSLDVMNSEGTYVSGSADGARNRRASTTTAAEGGAQINTSSTSPRVGSGKFEAIRRNTATKPKVSEPDSHSYSYLYSYSH